MDILSKLAVLLDNKNSLRVSIWEIMSSKTESIKSAEHTEALNSTHLALLYLTFGKNSTVKCNRHKVTLLDILCVGNYLNWSVCTDVNLTNEQCICIFVRAFGKYLSHNYL